MDKKVVTFNYTTLAASASPSALYFNGNLTKYVDIENKNDLHVDDLQALDLASFFRERLPQEMCLNGDRIAIPVPAFMPPLKLKPVISDRKYDNRITVVQADLNEIDLSRWLENQS